jgi:hypothetical protein
MKERFQYLTRVFQAYLTDAESQLSFWHGDPEVNDGFDKNSLGQYYMPFTGKANYSAYLDENDIPLLNYHGKVGLQYNPIAIAQYGLGNFNQFHQNKGELNQQKFLRAADWLVENLEANSQGIYVWNHYFDWEYRDTLLSPWYSALSQGQGISCLVRAHQLTENEQYLKAAQKAFRSFQVGMDQGGVVFRDSTGYLWLEEAIVDPPTHILNGFVWALWGIYDYFLSTADNEAEQIYLECLETLVHYLPSYDTGFWSLYEHAGKGLKMLASPFYHRLHIVQLTVMHQLTGIELFINVAQRWKGYKSNKLYSSFALLYKMLFKVIYY